MGKMGPKSSEITLTASTDEILTASTDEIRQVPRHTHPAALLILPANTRCDHTPRPLENKNLRNPTCNCKKLTVTAGLLL
jgi:hypothetical protein